ncbi:hypothetical protein F4860DRAFT_465472 [Xylaria cubensis]|nr:hypothetical protein F4860DRAFT_465472 [Xylaria cubensis]
MDLEMVLDWLGHLDSRLPPKLESVVWPPTPQTYGYYLRLPMKRAVNLNKLDKPVSWSTMDIRELEARMTDSEFANLYQSIMAAQTKGYLPKELYSVLKAEISRVEEDEKDSRFAERPVRPNPTLHDLGVTTLVQKPGFRSPQPIQEDEKPQLLAGYHTLSLAIELEALRDIRKKTKEHLDRGLVEASWNEGVHKAMLKLATQHTPSVCAANVTRAVIMKDYLPKTSTST